MVQAKLKSEPVVNTESPINEQECNSDDNTCNTNNKKRPKPIPFWAENPNILFNQKYLFEL